MDSHDRDEPAAVGEGPALDEDLTANVRGGYGEAPLPPPCPGCGAPLLACHCP